MCIEKGQVKLSGDGGNFGKERMKIDGISNSVSYGFHSLYFYARKTTKKSRKRH